MSDEDLQSARRDGRLLDYFRLLARVDPSKLPVLVCSKRRCRNPKGPRVPCIQVLGADAWGAYCWPRTHLMSLLPKVEPWTLIAPSHWATPRWDPRHHELAKLRRELTEMVRQ